MKYTPQVMAVGILAHGPADVLLTTAAWHFETNPAVLELGIGPWLAVKLVALVALSVVYLDIDYHINSVTYAAAGMAMIGVLAVFSNLAYLYIHI